MDIGLYYYNARYYAPTLARFLNADTLIPDPTNPQSLNRYTYVLNAPVRYLDPTGHFTEDAIRGYLWGYCAGEETCFIETFNQWRGNGDWWSQLRNAQAGDILVYVNTPHLLEYITFEGEGKERLDGAYFSDASGRKRLGFYEEATLNDFFTDATWIPGSIRWQNNKPVFQLNSGYDISTWQKPGWQRTLEDVAWDATGGIAVTVLCPECSLGAQLLGGAAFEVFSLPDWWRNNVSMTTENDLWVALSKKTLTLGHMNFRIDVSGGGNWVYQDRVNGGWQYE